MMRNVTLGAVIGFFAAVLLIAAMQRWGGSTPVQPDAGSQPQRTVIPTSEMVAPDSARMRNARIPAGLLAEPQPDGG